MHIIKKAIIALSLGPPILGQMDNSYHNFFVISGFYDGSTVRNMLKECSKMSEFDHPNVLTLRGVCLDGGPAPYIIMPFMANGNLLTYLKNNRKTLVIASGSEDEEVSSGNI